MLLRRMPSAPRSRRLGRPHGANRPGEAAAAGIAPVQEFARRRHEQTRQPVAVEVDELGRAVIDLRAEPAAGGHVDRCEGARFGRRFRPGNGKRRLIEGRCVAGAVAAPAGLGRRDDPAERRQRIVREYEAARQHGVGAELVGENGA